MDIKQKLANLAREVTLGRYRYTIHGTQQRIARRLKREDIEQAILKGEIIEDYPEHHYGPACLLMGVTKKGKVLHVLCGLEPVVTIITVYEPDPNEWESNWKVRKKTL